MRYPVVFLLALLPLACGKQQELTSHGQPVGHWVEELKNSDPKARKKAVTALGNVGAADPAVVPALASALKDADAGVRNQAALALLRIGPDAKEALPALEEAKKDRDATVRANAGKAVERIQGG
jgi:HEAT repeat protein